MAYGLATYSDKVERTDLMDVIKNINSSPTPLISSMTLSVQGLSGPGVSSMSGTTSSMSIFKRSFGLEKCPNCKKEYEQGEEHNCMASLRNLLEDI